MKPTLIDGPVGPLLIKQTIPMFWGLVSIIIFNLIDAYFVAQLGTSELAAVSFTFPIIMVMLNCAFGVGIGTATVVAIAVGEGKKERAHALITNGLFLAFIVLGLLSIIGLLTMDVLFTALGAKGYLLSLVKQYMSYIYFGMIFPAVAIVGNSSLRAIGNTFWPGVIMAISAVVNIILDPILIFGQLGFPRLELEGAAIATVISWIFSFSASIIIVHFKEKLLSFSLETRRQLIDAWKVILYVAIPAAWTNLILPLAIAIVTAILARFGEWAVAAFGVATRIEALAFAVLTAISTIIGPFIGQNWAAQKKDRVREALRLTFTFSVYFGLFLTVLLAGTSHYIVPLFDDNPQVVRAANQFFWVAPIGYAGYGIMMIVCAGFNALHKPFTSSWISMVRAFGIYIPLAFLVQNWLGPIGIFATASVANIISAIIGAIMILHYCRQQDITV